LFAKEQGLIPFYFEIKASDITAENAAHRFLSEFLLQTVAYRRRDARMLDNSPTMQEIGEVAPPFDGYWVDRLIETYQNHDNIAQSGSLVRNCLSAPLRAEANDARAFVMIDGLH